MEYERIKLWENTPEYRPEWGLPEPNLEVHPVENPRGCVVVIPGGGYEWIAFDHEGRELAEFYNARGYYAYILTYRHLPYRHPIPQGDVNRAIRYARYRAEVGGYDAHKIAVIGFSAGGHLAMTACTKFDSGLDTGDAIDRVSSRPDLGVLCYGVLTLGTDFTHWGTTLNLLGEGYDPAVAEEMSAAGAARPDMPPCLIWHTAEDDLVPVQNSLEMARAMRAVGVPYELHVFPFGGHGLGLATGVDPYVGRWGDWMIEFFQKFWG